MNIIGLIRNSTTKPSPWVLIGYRNSSFFGFPHTKCHHTLTNSLQPPFRILGFQRIMGSAQKIFGLPSSCFGLCSKSFSLSKTNSDVSTIACVASKVQNFSTSVETRVDGNNFERIYVEGGGMNVKPLVVERVDKDSNVGKSKNEEETKVEKEAWKLLQGAVVTYCGNPVGTVAANDLGDKIPLNYDQVFVRDFIPSALAFLLRGEYEIVRNFLLHTLQLQVLCPFWTHLMIKPFPLICSQELSA